MPKKPSNLIYGIDDKPPVATALILGLQHVMVMFISVIFPVYIIHALGDSISLHDARSYVSLSMIAGGITTILQSLKKGYIGSSYLCPSVSGPSYLSASLLAAKTGGLSLLFGMTGFVGFVEVAFSRIMHKLRFLFPSEVTGVVVTLVGIVVIPMSVQNFFGLGFQDTTSEYKEVFVALATFAIMIGLNIYSKGKLKLYCTILGMLSGYLLSFALGIITIKDIHELEGASFFAIPYIENMSWSFDARLVIPFIVAALCSTFKTVGDISTCQRINDEKWQRPDMKSVSGGIFADGLGGVIPGLIGGFGQSTSSSNVGLSVATGATSRIIAWTSGGIFIFLAFFPKLSNIFIIMPKPVMGATLIFAVSFMIIQGFQIIMSRMLDGRKIFVIGTSLIFGLSADMLPHVYENVHPWLQPIVSSSLSLGAVTAVVLNLFFRIGINKKVVKEFFLDDYSSENVMQSMKEMGSAWGARREVIYKAESALCELMEGMIQSEKTTEKIKLEAVFNEVSLELYIRYTGELPEFPDKRPSRFHMEDESAHDRGLSGFLIRKYVDKLNYKQDQKDCVIHMHFEH